MGERPDLEKLLSWLSEKEQAGEYQVAHASLEILISYCRELEAENKRLRADIDWQNRIGDLEPQP